ncbi:protein phosphatase 1F isoform X2 [Oncorhynchus keta]|uniref:protein phosphatase 1F isoform X2 n=1 Tax=Oncorhynchus keta TaxID=8018 RepID=UPI00227BACB9|nr:protein phosphatase 1F isoform X2 [Oncorhynchus keta]
MGGVMEEEVVRGCLRRFLEDFPAPLGPEDPLPLNPLSRKVTLDELRGESLDLGLRLLNTRDAPSTLNAAMCHAALAELLKADLSPFHLPQETEQQQGEEQEVVLLQSEPVQRLFLNKLREVGVAWHQNLPSPLPIGSSRFLMCSAHAIRNTRRKMEDRHVTLPDFNTLTGLKRLRSGTTGVAVLLQGEWLHVAWLGDSQSMLVRRGQDITLMDPHKPDREDEKQRVEGLGGCIVFMGCWRVNGTYAVSRAIGDFDQKPYVSGDADCSSTRLHGDEDYILLACDGFFDVVRPAEVPALVLGALREQGEPQGAVEGAGCEEISEGVLGERVAQELVAHAKAAGSSDNITVMVVFLCPPAQLLLQDQSNIAVATEGPAQE